MISFEKAFSIVMTNAFTLKKESVELAQCLHRILAGDIKSDIDMPPFNKSAMDGYACRREDLHETLNVIEVIQAGYLPQKTVGKNECAKIMTGAIMPEGADCVAKVENTEITAGHGIRITENDISANICYRGEDIKRGEFVLRTGALILPQHIAVLANAGMRTVPVYKKPRVSIITTGSELREPGVPLPDGCIRNSNSYQLIGQLQRIAIEPEYLGIADDTENSLDLLIKKALSSSDIVLLSGGVSMGDYDLVPAVLEKNGVRILFNMVAMQPGKPLTFGMRDKTAVFAFPGNPVSTFFPFEIMAKPFIYKLMGHDYVTRTFPLITGVDFTRKKAERKTFIPVKIMHGEVFPVEFHGSAHINSLCFAEGIISFPLGVLEIRKGQAVEVILL